MCQMKHGVAHSEAAERTRMRGLSEAFEVTVPMLRTFASLEAEGNFQAYVL